MKIKIRDIVITRLEIIETELIETAKKLQSKAVFFKQDDLAMKNIEKALTEVLKAQKHLKEK
jgi:hypothetical protein